VVVWVWCGGVGGSERVQKNNQHYLEKEREREKREPLSSSIKKRATA
jgi:hypothetical protein